MSAKKPPAQKFLVRLSPELHRQLMTYAGLKGIPLSDIIGDWVETAWKQQPEYEEIVRLTQKLGPPHAKGSTDPETDTTPPGE